MIVYLNGTLTKKGASCCIVEANGVGYHLNCSTYTVSALPETGSKVKILTTLIVREDNWQLYGFSNEVERSFFEKLISVSGVGPKAALSLLSSYSVKQLGKAIATEDEKLLSTAPGIGRKTAGRIIVELKEKIVAGTQAPDNFIEARDALVGLGYDFKEAGELLKGVEGCSTEELVKEALKKLAAKL